MDYNHDKIRNFSKLRALLIRRSCNMPLKAVAKDYSIKCISHGWGNIDSDIVRECAFFLSRSPYVHPKSLLYVIRSETSAYDVNHKTHPLLTTDAMFVRTSVCAHILPMTDCYWFCVLGILTLKKGFFNSQRHLPSVITWCNLCDTKKGSHVIPWWHMCDLDSLKPSTQMNQFLMASAWEMLPEFLSKANLQACKVMV